MIRTFITAMAFGTVLSGPSTALVEAAAGQGMARDGAAALPVEWTLTPSDREGRVQLSLGYRINGSNNSSSRPWPIEQLQGLSAAQLNDPGNSPASFRIVAEAGSLDCIGALRAGRGGGTCDFRPNRDYAADLERRGFGRATDRQLYQLAVQGAGREVIEALERHGYARTDINGLVAAAIHGVSADYVRGMAEAGYRVGSMDKLVAFRIHGVSPDYVRALSSATPEMGRLDADGLVAMRIHGVSSRFVREMAELGYRNLSVSQLTAMRIHGVSSDWVRQLQARGVRGASPDDLVSLRIHGGRRY